MVSSADVFLLDICLSEHILLSVNYDISFSYDNFLGKVEFFSYILFCRFIESHRSNIRGFECYFDIFIRKYGYNFFQFSRYTLTFIQCLCVVRLTLGYKLLQMTIVFKKVKNQYAANHLRYIITTIIIIIVVINIIIIKLINSY